MLSTFGTLNADKLLDEKAPNLEQFGLTKPSLSVTATKQDGNTVTLLFGDETPTNSGSYAELAGDPRGFIVASYHKSSLDKTENDLRDKPMLTLDSEKLRRVASTAKQTTAESRRNKEQFQIQNHK